MSLDDKVPIRCKRTRQPTNFYGYGVTSVKKHEKQIMIPNDDAVGKKEMKKKIKTIDKVLKTKSKETNNSKNVRPKRERTPTNFFAYDDNTPHWKNKNDALENNTTSKKKKKVRKMEKEKTSKTNWKKRKNNQNNIRPKRLRHETDFYGFNSFPRKTKSDKGTNKDRLITHENDDNNHDNFLDMSKSRCQKSDQNVKEIRKLSKKPKVTSGNNISRIDRTFKPEVDSLISCYNNVISFRRHQYSDKIEHNHTIESKPSPYRPMNEDCCLLQTSLGVNKTIKNTKLTKKPPKKKSIQAKRNKNKQQPKVNRYKKDAKHHDSVHRNKKSIDRRESKPLKHETYSDTHTKKPVKDIDIMHKTIKKYGTVQDSLSSLYKSKPLKSVKNRKVKAHVGDENERHRRMRFSMDSLQLEENFQDTKNRTNIPTDSLSSMIKAQKNNSFGNLSRNQSAIDTTKKLKMTLNACGSKCFDISFADSDCLKTNCAFEESINFSGKREPSHPVSIKQTCGTKCSDISFAVSEKLCENDTLDCQKSLIGSSLLQKNRKEADRQKHSIHSATNKRQKDPTFILENQSTLKHAIKASHKDKGLMSSTHKINSHTVNSQRKESTYTKLPNLDKKSPFLKKNQSKESQAHVQSIHRLSTMPNKKKYPILDIHNKVNDSKSVEKSKTDLVQCKSIISPSNKRNITSTQRKETTDQLGTRINKESHLDLESTKNLFRVHNDTGISSLQSEKKNIVKDSPEKCRKKDHMHLDYMNLLFSRKESQEKMEEFLVHFRQSHLLSSTNSRKLRHHVDVMQYDSSSSSSDISLFSRRHL